MNAPLPALPPASPAAASSPSANAQDTAAPEVPFSQVLSSEMAQQRRAEASAQETAPAETQAETGDAELGAPDATTVKLKADVLRDDAENASLPSPPSLPDAMLALALHPEMLKPAAASVAPVDETTGPRTFAGNDTARGIGESAAGIEAGAKPANRARPAEPRLPQAGMDDRHNRTELVGAQEKTAVAETLAARLPDAAHGVARAPDFSAAMAIAQTAQVATAATASLQASERLSPSVGTPAWNQALGDRIVWMAAGGQQSASLTLNPPDLGPMQVVVNVSNDQATASFFAAQPEVRQALEAALPRLREMMQDAGIQLGQATVSADTPRQQDNSSRDTPRALPVFADAGAEGAAEASLAALPVRTGRGLVDTFA